jgi:hypothetical protein
MSHTKEEALKLASALDHWATQMDMGRKPDPKSLIRKASAELRRLQAELDALKQALAAQPVQEPLGKLCVFDDADSEFGWSYDISGNAEQHRRLKELDGAMLYTTPPPAQPAPTVQEPVAIVDEDGVIVVCNYKYKPGDKFYTTPAAAPVPLTDEQIDAATKAWFENDIGAWRYPFRKRMRAAFAAAHGITGKGQP